MASAPGRLSMMKDRPSGRLAWPARARATKALGPPTAKPTASLTGLAGQAPAQETLARSSTASTLRAAPTPMFT